MDALDACFHDLAQSPRKGRLRDEAMKGLRSYPQGSHVIFYLIKDDDIQIVDILHKNMDIPTRIKSWTQD